MSGHLPAVVGLVHRALSRCGRRRRTKAVLHSQLASASRKLSLRLLQPEGRRPLGFVAQGHVREVSSGGIRHVHHPGRRFHILLAVQLPDAESHQWSGNSGRAFWSGHEYRCHNGAWQHGFCCRYVDDLYVGDEDELALSRGNDLQFAEVHPAQEDSKSSCEKRTNLAVHREKRVHEEARDFLGLGIATATDVKVDSLRILCFPGCHGKMAFFWGLSSKIKAAHALAGGSPCAPLSPENCSNRVRAEARVFVSMLWLPQIWKVSAQGA